MSGVTDAVKKHRGSLFLLNFKKSLGGELDLATSMSVRLRNAQDVDSELEAVEAFIEAVRDRHLHDKHQPGDVLTMAEVMYSLQLMIVSMEIQVTGRYPYITQTVATTSLASYLGRYCCAFRTRPRRV